ncbi:MAG: tetratricopeptide repeat protein, partial [Candidatus Wukongarchaeota archaeon]|nr:tetratricopeptide repeat protein [Candidatus Wukongarchaeota archaeon]
GDIEKAIECFDKAIEIDPNFAEAWYNKGRALEELGKTKEADACIMHAFKLNPSLLYYVFQEYG